MAVVESVSGTGARIGRALIEELSCSVGDALRLGYARLRVAGLCPLEVLTEHVRDAVTRPNVIAGRGAAGFCLFHLALLPPKAAAVVKFLHSASVHPGHLHQAAEAVLPRARSLGSTNWDPLRL